MSNLNQNSSVQIATQIRNQIGRSALYMLGAKDIFAIENGLRFKIRGCRKINLIRIKLNEGKDLYSIEFIKFTKTKINTVASYQDVYAVMLKKMIAEETGLALSL